MGGKNKAVIRVLVRVFIYLILFVFTTKNKPDLYIFEGIYLKDTGKKIDNFEREGKCVIHSELGRK